MELEMKTLRVTDETHRELTKLGSYGETMDEIINRCIQAYKKHEGFKK